MSKSFLFCFFSLTALVCNGEESATHPLSIMVTEGRQHLILSAVFAQKTSTQLTGFRVSTQQGRIIQFIPHQFDVSASVGGYLPISLHDCNFDGFTDIELKDDGFSGRASRNQTYTFWAWDKDENRFYLHKQLTELGIREIDPKTGYLHASGSDGGGGLGSRHL